MLSIVLEDNSDAHSNSSESEFDEMAVAGKLGDISTLNWQEQLRERIKIKYKSDMPYEIAQERLLSIAQKSNETLDAYAGCVRALLDALNSASTDDNTEVRSARMTMNEDLAVRKFKTFLMKKIALWLCRRIIPAFIMQKRMQLKS